MKHTCHAISKTLGLKNKYSKLYQSCQNQAAFFIRACLNLYCKNVCRLFFEAEQGKFSKDSRAIVLKFNTVMTEKKHKQIEVI